jgi:hypothetical protein
MGAHGITTYIHTDTPLAEAWEKLYRGSRDEYGSDAYSGSFATCRGVVLAGEAMGRTDAEAASHAIFLHSEPPARLVGKVKRCSAEKWGPALAIPVLDPAQASWRRRTVQVELDTIATPSTHELIELAHDKLALPAGSWIEKPEIVDDKVRSKKRVRRASGKSSMTYRLESRMVRTGEVSYATEREAIEAANKILAREMERGYLRDGESITIVPVRSKGGAHTTVGIELAKRRIKYTVEAATPKAQAGSAGWFFFAMAAS